MATANSPIDIYYSPDLEIYYLTQDEGGEAPVEIKYKGDIISIPELFFYNVFVIPLLILRWKGTIKSQDFVNFPTIWDSSWPVTLPVE